MKGCFGGVVVHGAPYAALQRVILAFQSVPDESMLDESWHHVEFAADHFQNFPETSDRIWYRQEFADNICTFSSLEPAESKTTPPDGGVVVDIPKGCPRLSCREIVGAVVGACESYARPITTGENELLATAKRLLSRDNGRVEASFKSDIRSAMGCSEKSALQTAIDDLYKTYLFKCTYNIFEFTVATVLMRLQWETGIYIEQDWVADPVAPLRPYFGRLYDSADSRAELLESGVEICNIEYRQARSELKAALMDESWDISSRKLRIAYHRVLIVNLFRSMFEHYKIWPAGLEFAPVLAEEACACIMTGIAIGAQFCVRELDEEAFSFSP